MSQTRHNDQVDDDRQLIRTLGLKLSKGHIIGGHAHSWGQVIFASRGVMQVDAEGSRWIVPPLRCLWVPAEIDHTIKIISRTWMRTIYVRPDIAHEFEGECRVIDVSPLLRELILETINLEMLSERVPAQINLVRVLIDQLLVANEMSMKITMPTDSRALKFAEIISSDPANREPLGNLAREVGASPRTLERIFVRQTGMSVGRWRQQLRFMMSVRLLVEGKAVNQAAFAAGYESPSAFVAMFKREAGFTPGQYLRDLNKDRFQAV